MRHRVTLELPDGVGAICFELCSRQLAARSELDDGSACSACSGDTERTEHGTNDSRLESLAAGCRVDFAGSTNSAGQMSTHADGHGGTASFTNSNYDVEHRWQTICEFERARADQQTIEGLHRDLEALIQARELEAEPLPTPLTYPTRTNPCMAPQF